jgi:predicted transcriptional regulator
MSITIDLPPELEEQLVAQASREGADPEAVAQRILSRGLSREAEEYAAALEGIRRGFADSDAGRVISLEDWDRKVRKKYGIPDDVRPMTSEEAARLT